MYNIQSYKIFIHFLFLSLFIVKIVNVFQEKIDILIYLLWVFPLTVFYFFIIKLNVKAYQWFCFVLIIYFLSASLRVFGTDALVLDILEILLICSLFINIMFGPRIINNTS